MSRDTSMRGAARTRPYSYRENGRQNRGGVQGDHIIKNGSGVEIWKPSWKQTTTTIRIFPALAPENPTVFDPWRFSPEDDDWGDWVRTYPTARNFGNPGVTFILNDPADNSYDTLTNPAWILYNAISRAVRAGQGAGHWAPLLMGGMGRGAQLHQPDSITLIQCCIWQTRGRQYDPPRGGEREGLPVVMELSPSAAKVMMQLMNERVQEFRGDPDDFQSQFVYGDPVSLEHGKFVHFYQLGHDPREQQTQRSRQNSFGQSRPGQGGSGGGDDREPIGYGCFMTPDYEGIPACLAGHEELVKRKWRAWDDIIYLPSHEEQVKWLCSAFPADVVVFALREMYGEMIPEAVMQAGMGELRKRGYDGGQDSLGGVNQAQAQPPAQAPAQRRGFGGDAAPTQTQGAPPAQQAGQPAQAPPATTQPPTGAQTQPAPATRRGFGADAPSSSPTTAVAAETTPTQGLASAPASVPVGAGAAAGFDAPPAAGQAPGANAAADVMSAISNSRRRVQSRATRTAPPA